MAVSSGTTVTVKWPGTRMLNTMSSPDTKLGFSDILLVADVVVAEIVHRC